MREDMIQLTEEESAINHNYIVNYIRGVLPPHGGILQEMEEYAHGEADVPIVQPEVARYLEVMCGILRPRNILEVGTASGYIAGLRYGASGCRPHRPTLDR